MRKFLFIIFCCAIFFCCSSNDKIPPGILPVNQMKTIVWDLMKAGELAANDTLHKKNISLKDSAELLFSEIFALHKIDKNTFYTSYNYYLQNTQWNVVLMDSVNEVANREKILQYMHPPVIPPGSKPQINKLLEEKIKNNLFKRKLLLKDSAIKKNMPL